VNAGSDRIRTVGSKPYYRTRYALATLLHSRYSDRSAFLDHIPRGSAQWMPFGFGTLIVNTDTAPTLSNDPLTDSLFGEYARMLLVGTAGCSAIAAAVRIGVDPIAAILVVGNILVLASLVTSRLAGIVRCLLLIGFALALSWATRRSSGENAWWSPVVFFSPAVLLASLLLLAARDFVTELRRHSESRHLAGFRSYLVLGFAIVAVVLLTYVVIVPSVDSFLEQFRERPNSYTIEELTMYEQLRIRTAKFAVFAVVAYFGACVGSFLNVVAASAPRGESITLNSSSCPQCQMPIRRIDNLPIVSYLNLGGRCRSCGVGIPIRYLAVEIVAMTIFAALFLSELVTGAANVPGFAQYQYAGIVWIILYTKWLVVGIYFYHCALLSCLLMLALMEADRLRCPRWMAGNADHRRALVAGGHDFKIHRRPNAAATLADADDAAVCRDDASSSGVEMARPALVRQ